MNLIRFQDIAVGLRFYFEGSTEQMAKTSRRRYRDSAGVVHLSGLNESISLVPPTRPAPQTHGAHSEKTQTLGADTLPRRGQHAWKCPKCQKWVRCEMSKNCVDCRKNAAA